MPNLTYSYPDFIPFTKILSSEVNAKFNDIKTLLNTTKLDDTNLQNAGITRATKLKPGTPNYVVINDGTGAMSETQTIGVDNGGLGFDPSFPGNAGLAIVVNDAETGLELGSPSQSSLTQAFAGDINTLTAGESISLNDAVCLDLHNGSGTPIYRIFRCDSDIPNRKTNFLGFALAAASVTPNILTWTGSSDFVTGNDIEWQVNGRVYVQSFNTDNDTTLAAIATQLTGDEDIATAIVTNAGSSDRVITITSIGGLSLDIPTPIVAGGASQPSIAIAVVQAASGQNVRIRNFGLLQKTGLTTGYLYYLSNSAGQITATPTDGNPKIVGQALSSNELFVNPNVPYYFFTTPAIMVRSHGGGSGLTAANNTNDVEHFSFTSWASGAPDSNNIGLLQAGDGSQSGYLVSVDGYSNAASVISATRRYNKSSWSSAASNRVTPLISGGIGSIGDILYVGLGSTGSFAGGQNNLDSFDGTSWSTETDFADSYSVVSCFAQGGLVHWCGGTNTAGNGLNNHYTFDGSSQSSDTVFPQTSAGTAGSSSSGGGVANEYTGISYQWNGSAWSSSIAVGYVTAGDNIVNIGPVSGYNAGTSTSYMNGGSSASTVSVNTTVRFNGATYTMDTASTSSRAGGQGAVY